MISASSDFSFLRERTDPIKIKIVNKILNKIMLIFPPLDFIQLDLNLFLLNRQYKGFRMQVLACTLKLENKD